MAPHDIMPVPDWRLPEQAEIDVSRLLDLSGPERIEHLRASVENLARSYLRQRKQDTSKLSRAGQRDALNRVDRAASKLLDSLAFTNQDVDAWFALFLAYRQAMGSDCALVAFHRMRGDMVVIQEIAERAKEAIGFLGAKPGPEGSISLYILVHDLCALYRELTGKPVTHSPYKGTKYVGAPQSHAGRFVALVVRAIDPAVTPQQINTTLQYVVQKSRTPVHGRKPGK